ncbi:3D domain-containing protein [Bacillus sp. JJ1503]|uniref:3D domain-containing protein n=1 Tax=Bacillus sp. JJ1503 TaxID=3122956 RepID=UPI002FFD6849
MTQILTHANEVASEPYEMPTVLVEAVESPWRTFEATAYTAQCDGCIGITKTGVDVRNTIRHNGRRIIAVDPNFVPLGSVVEVRLTDGSTFEAEAQDIGGAIKGARIDLLVADKATARQFGRQNVEIRIIEEGKR